MNKKSLGILFIGSAIIWACVIIGCSYKLSGTECYDIISSILIVGAIAHLMLNGIVFQFSFGDE